MKRLLLIGGLLVALSGLIRSVNAQTTIVGYGSNDANEIRLINLETGQIEPSPFDSFLFSVPFKGLAIDPAGENLYGTDQNGNLYRIEIATGIETPLGNMGIVVPDKTEIEAADFNFNGTELWVTDFDSNTPTIYKINNFDTTDPIGNPISATPVQTVSPGIGGGVVRTMTADTTKDVWLANDSFDFTYFNAIMDFQSIDTEISPPDTNVTNIGRLDDDPSQPFMPKPKINGMDRSTIDGELYGLSLDGGIYHIDQNDVPSLGPNNDARVELIGTAAGHSWLALAISTADSSGEMASEIDGTVFCDLNDDGVQDVGELGITGVTVELTCTDPDGAVYTDTQITAINGLYLFTGVPAGSCDVTVDVSTAPFDKEPGNCPTTVNVELAAGQIYNDVDFCFRELGEIGDTVFYDINNDGVQQIPDEPGIAGVDVVLECLDTDGTVLFEGIQTTDANGMYLFTGVPAGSCAITVEVDTAPADKEPGICPQIVSIQLQPGQIYLDADFCFRIKSGVIGDLVWCDTNDDGMADFGEPSIEGVVVNLTCTAPDGTVYTDMQTTDADGEYLFTGVPPGECVVEVDLASVPVDKVEGSNCPISVIIPLAAGQSYLDADFCFKAILSEVGDFVWCDLNDDGVQDPGEPGIEGVAVNLTCTAPDGTVYTDMQITNDVGVYLFTDVPAGICDVTVDVTTAPAGKEPGSCPITVNVDLAAGESFLNADFCFKLICGDCDGKVTRLTLQYNGINPAVVKVKQKKPCQVIFDSGAPLNSGDQFDIEIVNDNDGNLKNTEISLYLGCRLNAEIHTSCSKPIGPGLVSGSFEVIGGESRNGGILCSPQNGDGGKDCCEGKVANLTLQNGGDTGFITVKQKNGDVVFAENVDHLGAFSFIGTDKETLGTEISIFVNGCLNTKIHTSCSKPIGIGSVFGNFTVLEGASLKGGALCPVDEIIDDGVDDDSSSSDDDCCEGKVTILKLENGGASGFILVTQKNEDVVFAENVDHLGAFSFIGTDNETLGTEITITDSSGVETKIHTSCSKPIGIGSVFGDFTVLEGASLKGGALCPVDELGDDDGSDDDDSGHRKRKYKKSHSKDSKRSHKNCDKKSHKKHHKKRHN